jgi:hypothetical protein
MAQVPYFQIIWYLQASYNFFQTYRNMLILLFVSYFDISFQKDLFSAFK